MNTFPLLSTATPAGCVKPPTVIARDQRCTPVGEYFATTSPPLPGFSAPPPKSTLPPNVPTITTLPLPSIATPRPTSSLLPPKLRCQRYWPAIVAPAGVLATAVTLFPD